MEGNTSLKVRVRVRFLLFYSEVAPTDFTWTEKYEDEMPDEHPPMKNPIQNGGK